MEATKSTRNFWFVLFSYGDTRSTNKGWLALDKDEYNKAQAAKMGKSAAKRRGEREFNYFVVNNSYVTDSPEAFVKKCESFDMNPNLENYV